MIGELIDLRKLPISFLITRCASSFFKEKSIKKEDAQRVIKKEIGSFLRSINSPQFIANQFTRYHFNKMNLFDVLPTLENLTEKDLEEVLHLYFSDGSRTTLIVKGE